MTWNEVLEYRLKSNKVTMFSLGAMICMVGAFLGLNGEATVFKVGIAGLLLLAGILFNMGAYAMMYDGYSRKVFTRLTDLDDPPLKEWENRLEKSGQFTSADD